MNGNFKVGEVLVGIGFSTNLECNGMECEVTSGLHISETYDWYTHLPEGPSEVYRVMWADGYESLVSPYNLRRKQPPSGELSILNMFVVAPPQRTKEIA